MFFSAVEMFDFGEAGVGAGIGIANLRIAAGRELAGAIERNAGKIGDTRVAGAELVLQVRAKGVYLVEDAVPERIVIAARELEVEDGYDGIVVGATMREASRTRHPWMTPCSRRECRPGYSRRQTCYTRHSCWCPASWRWNWGGSAADRTPGERRHI